MLNTKCDVQSGLKIALTLWLILFSHFVISKDDVQFNLEEEKDAERFNSFVFETRLCMSESSKGMLSQGVRDSTEIVKFSMGACSNPLSSFMKNNLHRPAGEVDAFITAIAYDELKNIPGLKLQNSKKSHKWNSSAELIGVLGYGDFKNCCFQGKTVKDKYVFLKLQDKVDVISEFEDDEFEPNFKDVDKVQLGLGDDIFKKVKVGHKVTVLCKSLWFGSTGHYALPVYCSEPTIK